MQSCMQKSIVYEMVFIVLGHIYDQFAQFQQSGVSRKACVSVDTFLFFRSPRAKSHRVEANPGFERTRWCGEEMASTQYQCQETQR